VETKDVVKTSPPNGGTPLPAANAPKVTINDPIFQPQNYSNDQRVTQKLTSNGNVANPQTQYTRPPVPATRRWLRWMRNDTPPPQPPATPAGQKPMPVPAKGSSGVIGAAYHASTPYSPSVVTTREPVPAPAPAPAKESSSMIEAVYHPDPMFRLIGC